MQHFEYVASPLAEAVEIFTKNLGVKSIAGDIMRYFLRLSDVERKLFCGTTFCVVVVVLCFYALFGFLHREIGNTDPKDLERDSSGTRAYASFLTELAERIPAVALNHMMVLLPLLDEDVRVLLCCSDVSENVLFLLIKMGAVVQCTFCPVHQFSDVGEQNSYVFSWLL